MGQQQVLPLSYRQVLQSIGRSGIARHKDRRSIRHITLPACNKCARDERRARKSEGSPHIAHEPRARLVSYRKAISLCANLGRGLLASRPFQHFVSRLGNLFSFSLQFRRPASEGFVARRGVFQLMPQMRTCKVKSQPASRRVVSTRLSGVLRPWPTRKGSKAVILLSIVGLRRCSSEFVSFKSNHYVCSALHCIKLAGSAALHAARADHLSACNIRQADSCAANLFASVCTVWKARLEVQARQGAVCRLERLVKGKSHIRLGAIGGRSRASISQLCAVRVPITDDSSLPRRVEARASGILHSAARVESPH